MTAGRLLGAVLLLSLAAACTAEGTGGGTEPSPPTRVASPSDGAPPVSPAGGGSLRYGLSHEPRAIIPGLPARRADPAVDGTDLVVVDALFDSLTALDDQQQLVPAAARRWDVGDAGATVTFHLRRDATFHDGTPVTAGDFVRSWNRIADGTAAAPSPLAYRLAPVEGFAQAQEGGVPLAGLEAVDEQTLRVRLTTPFHDFPVVAAHPALGPLPPTSDSPGYADEPVGNGPFRMAEPWQHEQFVRVVRYEDHPRPARLTEVVFRIFTGTEADDAAYDEFRGERLHVAPVPADQLGGAVRAYGRSRDGYGGPGVLDGETLALYYYGFNVQQEPFDAPDVRRGLSLLLDRRAIARQLMAGTRSPAASVVAPPVPGHLPDTCAHCRYAPGEAAELLRGEAGRQVTLVHNEDPADDAIARRFKRDVEAATELTVALEPVPFEQLRARVRAGDAGLFQLGWTADVPVMDEFLTPLFSSRGLGATNLVRYSEPVVDELLARARSTADREVRTALYQQAERRIMDDAPLAPVMFFRLSQVVARDVRDLSVSPTGAPTLERAWLSPPP